MLHDLFRLPAVPRQSCNTSHAGGHGGAGSGGKVLGDPLTKAEHDEIAKEDYKKNVADSTLLVQLATQLKSDIDKQVTQEVSLTTIKEAEQIEKLAHGIRKRMKH